MPGPRCNTRWGIPFCPSPRTSGTTARSQRKLNFRERTCIKPTELNRHKRKTRRLQASRHHDEPGVKCQEKMFGLQTRNTWTAAEKQTTSRRKTQKAVGKTPHLLTIRHLQTKVSVYSELPWSRNPCRSELHEVSLACKTLGTHSKVQQDRRCKHR